VENFIIDNFNKTAKARSDAKVGAETFWPFVLPNIEEMHVNS